MVRVMQLQQIAKAVAKERSGQLSGRTTIACLATAAGAHARITSFVTRGTLILVAFVRMLRYFPR